MVAWFRSAIVIFLLDLLIIIPCCFSILFLTEKTKQSHLSTLASTCIIVCRVACLFSFLFLRVFDSTLVGGVSRDERPVAPSSYALVTRSKVKEKETNGITHATVSRNGHPSSFLFLFFFFADTSEIPSGTETFPFLRSPIVYESNGLGSSGLVIFHRRTHRVNVVSAVSRC